MVDYNFSINKEINFWAAACQIERALGVQPHGLSRGGDVLTIHFIEELKE